MSDRANESRSKQATPALEPPDVATALVLQLMAALAAFVALTLGGMWLFYSTKTPQALEPVPSLFAGPQLETSHGSEELDRLQAAQRSKLSGYAWVDRDNGLIHIPIEQAMQRIVSGGANGYGPLDVAAGASSKASSP